MVVERPPLSYVAVLALLVGIAAFVVLGFAGVLPVQELFVVMTTFVLVQALAVVLAFIGGLMVGLFLAHRILGSQDFTPFERAVLEGQEEIRELLGGGGAERGEAEEAAEGHAEAGGSKGRREDRRGEPREEARAPATAED